MASAFDCVVIGSGTTGVACAAALLTAGRSVHMIDAGVTLEPERARMVADARTEGVLTPANAPWLKEPAPPARVPRKLLFGSDFPFRDAAGHLKLDAEGMGAEPSFARGGLSNVWGASALPYTAHDMTDWPVSEAELAPHYTACNALLGATGEEDDLSAWLPTYGATRPHLNASRQAQTMLNALRKNRDALQAQGLRFGRARVAAKSETCVYCGLCLHGCPDRLIYSANDTMAQLHAHARFSYQPGVLVESISENGESAAINAADKQTGAALTMSAAQVFVAAGAIPSTAMLLRSADAYDHTLSLKDSQYFLLPMLLIAGAGRAREERLHTMAQIFLELRDAEISPHTIHLQVYTYNSLMAAAMRQRLGPMLEPLVRWGDAHFVLIQGYLHSTHSGRIDLTLKRDGLQARGVANPEARRTIAALVRKLTALSPRLGAVPVAPLMEITEPGRSFHIGGSLPMRAAPGRFETDTLGRPFGWRRVHAIDATVLPSVPATTITLPVMANAHRIASIAAGGVA